MRCEAGRCKTSNPKGVFVMTPSLEGLQTKAREAPSPHDLRLVPLDTNPVFQCLVIKTNTENSVEVGLFVPSLIHSFSFVYSHSN